MKVHKPTDTKVVIERVYKASQERVFAAWTDPLALAAWFGPEGLSTEVLAFNPTPGGAYSLSMSSPEAEETHDVSGEFREVVPHSRVVITWKWRTSDKATLVEVDLEPDGASTLLRLTHSMFPSAEVRDNHIKGWSSSFNCLDASLAT